MIKISTKANGNQLLTTISNGSLSIDSDLPIVEGGTNAGFAPVELIAAALGASTSMFITEFCKKNRLNIYNINIDIITEMNPNNKYVKFIKNITILGDISAETKNLIFEASKYCFIEQFLSYNTEVESNLI